MPMLTLIARDGRTPERSVELNPAETNTVGRSPDNHIVLNDPKVSRTHLRLVWRDGACWAEDAGSTFGTWRNGEKMSGPVRLAAGDRLTLGGYELVFDAAAGVPAAAHGKEPDGPEDVAMDPALAALAVLYTDEMMAMKKRIHE
ncbi:MAG: FHA domain-containing protein, partial [Lentisphaerae bacterium]|nr:FHA domain-containing protein [Lentisphaerota bacterium]